jgi:VIT1/CCC1 family predicted Fe2+/Mn2+ transporter
VSRRQRSKLQCDSGPHPAASRAASFSSLCLRARHNLRVYQSNYLVVAAALSLYCLCVCGTCTLRAERALIRKRHAQADIPTAARVGGIHDCGSHGRLRSRTASHGRAWCQLGHAEAGAIRLERSGARTLAHVHAQYLAVAVLCIPVFWLSSAGEAFFWTIGASAVITALHATLRARTTPTAPLAAVITG